MVSPSTWAMVTAVSVGAALGAVLRWVLGLAFNALWPLLPLGTLAANLVGCYLIGVGMSLLAQHPELSPLWRLFAVTGFLGGLTTFSTFSAEVVAHLAAGRWLPAGVVLATHVVAGLALTLAGMGTVSLFQR